ncbi:secreted phosphoprotein 24-like, partial [Astyanax mexicanus]
DCIKHQMGKTGSSRKTHKKRKKSWIRTCAEQVSAQFVSPLEVSCDLRALSSSSKSSSEEMFLRGTQQAGGRLHTPGFIICEGARSCSRLLL